MLCVGPSGKISNTDYRQSILTGKEDSDWSFNVT